MDKWEKIVDTANREHCFLMGSEYHNDPALKIRCMHRTISTQMDEIKRLHSIHKTSIKMLRCLKSVISCESSHQLYDKLDIHMIKAVVAEAEGEA